MIQMQTTMDVADNSGARKIMAIRTLGQRKKFAEIGDVIRASVKEAQPRGGVRAVLPAAHGQIQCGARVVFLFGEFFTRKEDHTKRLHVVWIDLSVDSQFHALLPPF